MQGSALAITSVSILAAVLLAGVVTISQHGSKVGRLVGYVACAIVGACPVFGRFAWAGFVVAVVVMAVAGVIGHRERARLQRGDDYDRH